MSFQDVSAQFATSLVQGNFAQAQSLLAEPLKSQMNPEQLKQAFEGMIAYAGSPAESAEVTETLNEWPDKQANDVGWAYVAVNGSNFSEAVTLTLAEEAGQTVIRQVVWGRP